MSLIESEGEYFFDKKNIFKMLEQAYEIKLASARPIIENFCK